MHIPSLAKIHWYLLKLSPGNKNTGMSRTDNSVKNWWNFPISNPKADLHNTNAYKKFGENPSIFTFKLSPGKENTDGRMTAGRMDNQCETIKPYHYRVVGYKKVWNTVFNLITVPCA